MPSTATTQYTSSVTLLIVGESLDPASVSEAIGMEPHESWIRGQPKRGGKDLHHWGGWKRHLPEALKAATVEEQMNYWIGQLLQKAEPVASIVESGARCSLDVFVSADSVWFRISYEVNQLLATMPLDIEFTFWSPSGAA